MANIGGGVKILLEIDHVLNFEEFGITVIDEVTQVTLLGKLRSWIRRQKEPNNLHTISSEIGQIINDSVKVIIHSYANQLLNEPISYIVPAIWGVTSEGPLSPLQADIHSNVKPSINKIMNHFNLKGMTAEQEFALWYVVRGVFVAQIAFALESLRNQNGGKESPLRNTNLSEIKPWGSA